MTCVLSFSSSIFQLLNSLGNVAEQSLPSLLRNLFRWYDRQLMVDDGGHAEHRLRHRSKGYGI